MIGGRREKQIDMISTVPLPASPVPEHARALQPISLSGSVERQIWSRGETDGQMVATLSTFLGFPQLVFPAALCPTYFVVFFSRQRETTPHF